MYFIHIIVKLYPSHTKVEGRVASFSLCLIIVKNVKNYSVDYICPFGHFLGLIRLNVSAFPLHFPVSESSLAVSL